jgi:ATP-binding cassette subfamily G (WHITE) protein 2
MASEAGLSAIPEASLVDVEVGLGATTQAASMIDQDLPKSHSKQTILSLVSPTPKEMKLMTKEEVEQFVEAHMNEHRQQLVNFNSDSIQRDPLATANSSITFKDVSFSVDVHDTEDSSHRRKVKKTILEDCCGHFEAGSLVALMGPSGCGKSTLLDILAKKKTSSYSGQIFLNGYEVDKMYQRAIAYVGQQDTMPEHWTTKEAVAFNFGLKNAWPATMTKKACNDILDNMLEDLGLLHVKDTCIGGDAVRGLSGGQRRRVTLARGMASGASVMFCDEPTSGLSATDAELCVKVMRLMAKKWGVTIVVVIHQPRVEVAQLFDQLVLLTSRPGRVVYDGPMKEASSYWSNVGYIVPPQANPTDFFLDVVTPGAPGANPDAFVTHYQQHQLPKTKDIVENALANPGMSVMEMLEKKREVTGHFGKVPVVKKSIYAVGFRQQLRIVFHRKLTLTLRDTQTMSLTIGMQVFMGIFLGLCFFNVGEKGPEGPTQMSFLFNLLMQVSLGSLNIMPQLINARTIMKLEVSEALYSEWAHIIACSVINTIQSTIGNTLFILLMFAFSGMPWSGFLPFFAWSLLLFLAMDSLCSLVAAVAKNAQTAQATAMPFLMIFIMFSGFLVSKNSAPGFLRWLLYVSPVSWVNEIIAANFYGDNPEAWGALQQLFGFERSSELVCVSICMACVLIFRLAEAFALKKLNNVAR